MSNGLTAPYFLQQFEDPTTGRPISGGTLTFMVGGSTSIPKVVYADLAKTNSLGNILTLDSAGYAPQYYMEEGLYKVILNRSNGSIVYTRDNIEGSVGSGSAEDTYKVKSDITDTNPDYLANKLIGGGTVSVGTANIPGVGLQTTVTGDGRLKTDELDALGYLDVKFQNTDSIEWTTSNHKMEAKVGSSITDNLYKVKTLGSDTADYLGAKIASSTDILKSTDANGLISFTLAGDIQPHGLAGGDLTGTYPNPLVKELSGLGTSYSPIPAVLAGTTTPLQFDGAGGRGIAFKTIHGIGMAIDSIGYVYSTQDGGLTWRKTTYSVVPGTDLAADIAYGKYDGVNYGWVFCEGRSHIIKYLPDVSGSYDSNGVPLQSAWVSVNNTTMLSWADITWNESAGYWVATGNNYDLLKRANLTTGDWVVAQSNTNVFGGVCVTNTGRVISFIRDTGEVFYTDNISATTPTWTSVLKGSTAILDYASGNTSGIWGSAVQGNGMIAFADYNAGLIVTTTDVADPNAYQLSIKANSLPGIYDICFDGQYWYATNGGTSTPAVYQLFIGSIPSHRQFIAEKGAVVYGKLTLPDITNADALGTDAWGNIVPKVFPTVSLDGYASTMYIANAVNTLAPNLIVRSELITLFVPTTKVRVYQGSYSKFGSFISQGGTGSFRYTLRDEQYRLIAQSYDTTNPLPQVFLELDSGAVFNPATGISVPYYDLAIGGRYYLGINWNANGIQLLGDDAVQNNNTQPYTAYKVDNLSSVPTQLTGGGESKQRPFIRLLTKV